MPKARSAWLEPRRDIVFEELEAIFGKTTNPAARGRRNRSTQYIRESIFQMAETDPDRFPRDDEGVRREIRVRYARMCQQWPGPRPTDSWLASRWDDCSPEQPVKAAGQIQNAWAGSPDTKPASSRDVALNYLRQWKEEHP